MSRDPELSLVVPVYDEEEAIPVFLAAVRPVIEQIAIETEIIFINDGSRDGTIDVLKTEQSRDHRIRIVDLSRNFGKEAALTAGLDFSTGDAVVPMDVDLQDPPELLVAFVEKWRDGYDNVYGQRVDRSQDSALKRLSAGWFYRGFNRIADHPIEENAGDFRLMSRAVVDATLALRERNRFMKGMFAWVGFNSVAVPYARPERAAGETKFNYWKLWNFALDGITSFSTLPLRIWTYVGGLLALCALAYTAIIIGQTLIFGRDVPGYASMMVAVLVLGAANLISLGIMGEYIGRLYVEAKERPIYVVGEAIGFKPIERRTGDPRTRTVAPKVQRPVATSAKAATRWRA
ncbi:glycosyltransferase family 2 protein [Altererythrobacter sp. CAU 1778]